MNVKYYAEVLVNTGNYENIKVAAGIEIPCEPGEEQETYEKAREFVHGNLTEEVKTVRSQKRSK